MILGDRSYLKAEMTNQTVLLELSDRAVQALRNLAHAGMYGSTLEETAARLLEEKLRQVMWDSILAY